MMLIPKSEICSKITYFPLTDPVNAQMPAKFAFKTLK